MIVISEILISSKYHYKEDSKYNDCLDNAWIVLNENISQFIDYDKILFVDISSDWCVTCKCIKIVYL